MKPLFVVIGEGHGNALMRYIDCSLQFYGDKIQAWTQPCKLQTHQLSFKSPLLFPGKMCLMSDEKHERQLVIADSGHNRIVIASLQGEILCKFGGTEAGFQDGDQRTVKFRNPQGVVFYPPSRIFVADTGNHSIRSVGQLSLHCSSLIFLPTISHPNLF